MPRLSFQIGEQSTGLVLPKPQNPDGSLENGEILSSSIIPFREWVEKSFPECRPKYIDQYFLADDERMNIASSLVYTI